MNSVLGKGCEGGPVPPDSQVTQRIHELMGRTSLLLEFIDNLENRLRVVLRDPVPTICQEKACEDLVPLASALRENTNRIDSACNQIESILQRLEV